MRYEKVVSRKSRHTTSVCRLFRHTEAVVSFLENTEKQLSGNSGQFKKWCVHILHIPLKKIN